MKLSAESPELTAYALGELNPAERAEVEAALDASPELRAELAEIQRTIGALDFEFSTEPVQVLSAEQRAAIVGQAAGLPTADSVAAEETRLTASEAEAEVQETVGYASRGWLHHFLAWRQQLIWATAGACALALTFTLWPRQRQILETANELRYQRLPESQAKALEVAGAPNAPARSSVPPPPAAASVPVKREPAPVPTSGRLETVNVAPSARPAPSTKTQASAPQRTIDLAANSPAPHP